MNWNNPEEKNLQISGFVELYDRLHVMHMFFFCSNTCDNNGSTLWAGDGRGGDSQAEPGPCSQVLIKQH